MTDEPVEEQGNAPAAADVRSPRRICQDSIPSEFTSDKGGFPLVVGDVWCHPTTKAELATYGGPEAGWGLTDAGRAHVNPPVAASEDSSDGDDAEGHGVDDEDEDDDAELEDDDSDDEDDED